MKTLRAAWPAQVAGIAPKDLVFVDESGVNLAMIRTYARSRRGTRAFGSAPRNRGDNVTILSALGWQGPLASMYLAGSTDGPVFLTYLKKVLVPKLWKGAVVIMDNLGAHKVAGVQTLIEAAGARLLHLPPYSADLQPHRSGLVPVQKPPAQEGRSHQAHAGPRHPRGARAHPPNPRPRLLRPLRLPWLTIVNYALGVGMAGLGVVTLRRQRVA